MITRFPRLLLALLLIKLGTCTVPSQEKMRSELEIGFNFLIRLELGFRVTRIGLVTLMLMKSISTRQTSLAVFVFPFTLSLGVFASCPGTVNA